MEPLSIASDPAASKTEQPSERAPGNGPRRSDSRVERRVPSARDSMATLPDGDHNDVDFEPHDTIPAPTWLDDELGGAGAPPTNEIAAPHKG